MKKKILFGIFALLLPACATTQTAEQRYSDEFANLPEYQAIDEELAQLKADTDALDADYAEFQHLVLNKMQFNQDVSDFSTELKIYINRNNLIMVNNQTMTRNDFVLFLDRNSKTICTPTPVLAIHPNADYDAAAWVLEKVYAAGCFEVNIVDKIETETE